MMQHMLDSTVWHTLVPPTRASEDSASMDSVSFTSSDVLRAGMLETTARGMSGHLKPELNTTYPRASLSGMGRTKQL